VQLYLLEGSKLTPGQIKYDERHGLIQEKDTECIIFAMYGGACVSFQFKNLHLKPWGEWKQRRIGRLLPPFLTRLQQRYSAYLQRPGLTRVPKQAVRLAENASEAEPGPAMAPQSDHRTNGSAEVAISQGPPAEKSSEPEIAPQSVSAQSERTLGISAPPQDAAKAAATYASEPVATKQPAAPQPKPTVEGPSQNTSPTDSTASKSGGLSVGDKAKSS
jgi:hypothetical protein